jgi:hypothetical protein
MSMSLDGFVADSDAGSLKYSTGTSAGGTSSSTQEESSDREWPPRSAGSRAVNCVGVDWRFLLPALLIGTVVSATTVGCQTTHGIRGSAHSDGPHLHSDAEELATLLILSRVC